MYCLGGSVYLLKYNWINPDAKLLCIFAGICMFVAIDVITLYPFFDTMIITKDWPLVLIVARQIMYGIFI